MSLMRQLLPPSPPAVDPNFVLSRVTESVAMVLVLIGVLVVAIKVLGPLARAWARRLEGQVGDPHLLAEIDHMREQLGDVDSLRARVGELEERLEFTERLLSQRRNQDLLARGDRDQ